MAYTSGDTILDDHYNIFVQGGASAVDHNTANVNTVWGSGTGDKGYGQSGTLSTVSAGTTITVLSIPDGINIGDSLYQLNSGTPELIGTITGISNGTDITVDAITTSPVNGLLCYAQKPLRVEGGEIRGYYLEVELTSDLTTAIELFSVNSNVVKSYL